MSESKQKEDWSNWAKIGVGTAGVAFAGHAILLLYPDFWGLKGKHSRCNALILQSIQNT